MENKKDYEQMYYDSQYEIKQLKKKIKYLEDTIYEMNLSRNKNNINLQAYIKKEKSKNHVFRFFTVSWWSENQGWL